MIKKILKKIFYRHKYNSETYINYLNKIGAKVANNVYFVSPSKVLIDETRPYLIEIGENVTITEGVTILTHGFDWSVLKVVYGDVIGSAGKVLIGNNCFIGVNTTILKGVTIGENTIIGAGSLVCKNIPPNSVAAGNPCKVICSLEDYYKKRKSCEEKEAKELIKSYYSVYKKFPPEEELSEFFWLFYDRNVPLNELYLKKMRYGGNFDFSFKRYEKEDLKFKSYKTLCEEAIGDELLQS